MTNFMKHFHFCRTFTEVDNNKIYKSADKLQQIQRKRLQKNVKKSQKFTGRMK